MKVYPNTSGARATVPIKRLLLEKDYAAYSGIRFECTQRPFVIPQSTFIPKKRRSLEPGIELITPIKKVGLEGGCDMEMGTGNTFKSYCTFRSSHSHHPLIRSHVRDSMIQIIPSRLQN